MALGASYRLLSEVGLGTQCASSSDLSGGHLRLLARTHLADLIHKTTLSAGTRAARLSFCCEMRLSFYTAVSIPITYGEQTVDFIIKY